MIEYSLSIFFIIIAFILSYQDITTYHISLLILYVASALYLLLLFILNRKTVLNSCISALFICLLFMFIRKLTKGNLGLGDIKFSFLCGLYTGFPGIIVGCLFSSLLGILAYLVVKLIKRKVNIKTLRIPFIPFLSIGCIIAKGFVLLYK